MKIPRLALVVPALLLVAACGAAGTSAMSDSGDSAGSASKAEAPGSAPEAFTSGSGSGGAALRDVTADGDVPETGTAADQPNEPATKAVISKGQISLRTRDVDKTRFDLQKLLDRWDGSIANEKSDADAKGRTERQRLELRVPSAHFDEAMDALSKLGVLVDRSRTSQDVTTEVIDNQVRVRTQKLSLARIQALLAKATNINQIISIEDQLSQRQADLDSLEQQQKYLADQTALATINLYLTVPARTAAHHEKDTRTFFSGLSAGWHHLGTSTSAVLTAIGAVLPFAALLALVAAPFWVARRRRLVQA
ncbi:MAG: DUF4349 domain-containing protein [Marmoricola sp.]